MKLEAPLTVLAGIGPRRSADLAEAGFHTVGDLLWCLPIGWEIWGETVVPSAVASEGRWRVAGRLERVRRRRLRGRGSLVEARLADDDGWLELVWFNQGWVAGRLGEGESVEVQGTVRERDGRWQMSHPELVSGVADGSVPEPRYGSVAGLGPRRVSGLVGQVLEGLDPSLPCDELASEVRERMGLPSLGVALRTLHRPGEGVSLPALQEGTTAAHRRLAFGELFAHQVQLASRYAEHRSQRKDRRYQIDDRLRQVTREILPFRLTAAQRRVVRELVDDLTSARPMLRLLQGDVGSGKTIVAGLVLLVAAVNGVRSAVLAPTELLAEQHAETLGSLFGGRYRVELLTARRGSVEAARGAEIVVGTHALLARGTELGELGLVVIDEQHRFGVSQREVMARKGNRVDLLVMSATPIPRTLALAGYGDLDLSVLDELPPGRQPVETLVRPTGGRKEVYTRLRRDLEAGGQGYVVFPAIRPSEDGNWVALEELAPRIEERFPGLPSARYHGGLPWEERAEIMERFRSGRVRLLLATSMVEVGVDVPEATAMVIEGAERFGLAQLHQLRGRVGRGRRASWCAAVHGKLQGPGVERLRAFAECDDGFAIAERDLLIRGPGELLGERQAGMISYRAARLPRDAELLVAARQMARERVLGPHWDQDGRGDTERWFDS